MKRYYVRDLIDVIDVKHRIIGNVKGVFFNNIKTIFEADAYSLVWVNPKRKDKQVIVEQTQAKMIICDHSIKITDELKKEKCFIVVENPKLAFIKIIKTFFLKKNQYKINPTSEIHPEARIHKDVYIGPFCQIGKCKIDKGSIIHSHCFINDNVKIGKNVILHHGCLIGTDGFNYVRDDNGKLHHFPHIGGVEIGDDVEIHKKTSIDLGTLGTTVIGRGTKVGSGSHISHNSQIGEDNVICGNTFVGGSTTIGDRCWISPSSTFRDVIKIGDGSFVGFGSLVVKDLEEKSAVMGSPARDINEYKRFIQTLKKIGNQK